MQFEANIGERKNEMVEKMDISNANEEAKRFIDYINREKITALTLPLLCSALMMIEMVIDEFVNMFPMIIGTFIFTSIVHIYVLFKLNVYQINLSNVLSAIINDMTIKELANMTPDQLREKELKMVKLNWRSLIKEYVTIIFSCFICMGVLFISVIVPFILK